MANGQHGGYREPRNPAPVSGPGALSQRTDGQGTRRLPNAAYGESKAFEEQQKAAPVAQANPINVSGLTPMDAETQFPERPVTDGVNAGLGAGESNELDEEDLLRLGNYLPVLKFLASQPYATNATKQYVRQLAALQAER